MKNFQMLYNHEMDRAETWACRASHVVGNVVQVQGGYLTSGRTSSCVATPYRDMAGPCTRGVDTRFDGSDGPGTVARMLLLSTGSTLMGTFLQIGLGMSSAHAVD